MPGMKRRTIKLVLRKKISDWLNSITDETLREDLRGNIFVTGGCISSMVLGEKINDYDIYFKNMDIAARALVYYCQKFEENKASAAPKKRGRPRKTVASDVSYGVGYRPVVKIEEVTNIKGEYEQRLKIYMKSAGVAAEDQSTYSYFEGESDGATVDFVDSLTHSIDGNDNFEIAEVLASVENKGYRPVFLSENAITLSNDVQLITRFYGDPAEVHKFFDFAHCMCYYDYETDHLELSQQSLESMLSKSLVYNGSLYPIASLFRIRKFLARGWRITAGQELKMIMQLNGVDLRDINLLKDQLMGVDVAYMRELLSALKDVPTKDVDQTYLMGLIDKIFED